MLLTAVAATSLAAGCSSSTITTKVPQQRDYEPIARSQYHLLPATSGSASANQFYILAFRIGKAVSRDDLENNAYAQAVENCPNADAVICARVKSRQWFFPLIVFNFRRTQINVSGRGIQLLPDSNILK